MLFRKAKNRFSNRSTEVIVGALLAFLVKLFGAASAFLLNIVVARSLGAEQAGYFFLAQALVVILAVLIRQGLDNALVRYIAGYQAIKKPDHVAGIYRLALSRVLPAGLLISAFVWICSGWLSEVVFSKLQLEPVLKWGALAIVPLALSQLHAYCFQGQKRIVHAMSFSSAALAFCSIIVFGVLSPFDASFAMQLYLVASVIVCLVSLILWNNGRSPKLSSLDFAEKKRVLDTTKPLFAIVVMSQATQWTGQLALGAWGNAEDVALFAVAQRTAMLTSLVLIAVNAIAAPKFAEAHKQDNLNHVRVVAKMSGKLMTICALPIVGFMILLAPWLMSLFGEEFVKGANILRVLALGQFINVITGSVGYLLQMTGYEKILRNNVMISSLITIVGSLFLIPVYGLVAAAWVTTIAISTQNLLCVYHVKKKLGFNTLNILKK
ncbi:flippase [Vibrio mediterranei]|uniref:flippase n=1 Tax=Vibrio mediterranei TaxID=689 RepID=UPI00148E0800|nr:flippase [Vibrio mediterranei]